MKLSGYLRSALVVGCVCGMVLGAGCRRRQVDSSVNPTDVGTGGAALTERPDAEGTRIPGLTLRNVEFAYDSFQVTDSEVSKVKEAAEYMKANADVHLVAEGNCDERGTAEYNISLGENRALAVRAYLIGLGIDSSRIQTKSYGKEKPLELGHDEASWARNRRVEFAMYKR